MKLEMLLDKFGCEKQCEYRGRTYLVRDNGSICRMPKANGKPSKWDSIWTFGKKDQKNGYMMFPGSVRVHIVVATAFYGPHDSKKFVVDHIDTNRCNNRADNLRWLTRLENALKNPITRRRIEYHCGSIDAFLENPSILRDSASDSNFEWMRTVSKEEAANCRKNLERWSREDKHTSVPSQRNTGIGEYIYHAPQDDGFGQSWDNDWTLYQGQRESSAQMKAEIEAETRRKIDEQRALKSSLTEGAKQLNWKTPTEFILCPQAPSERTLMTYLENLKPGLVFSKTQYGDGGKILQAGYNPSNDSICVLTHTQSSTKPWALCKITLQDNAFVHENCRSFFDEDGGWKYYTIAMGQEWRKGKVFDDYC